VTDPAEGLRTVLGLQAAACANAGSLLYERIITGVTAEIDDGGPSADVLLAHYRDDALVTVLVLRFLGAVHRIVLEGRAADLAACYPSVGGRSDVDAVERFAAAVAEHRDEIEQRMADGVQTNEVGRSAVLAGGYATVARRTGLPLRVLEVGTSAGLNLRWDRFWYDTGSTTLGDPASAVRFEGVWEGDPPDLDVPVTVAERRGCDRRPIDPTSEEGRLRLLSYIWPDQVERVERLEAAIDIAREVPATLDQASADDWVAARVADPVDGVATVVAHSIVLQYLGTDVRRAMRGALQAAGERATPDAPLHWLRMEPAGDRADLRLTSWPGATEEVLATCGFHGHPIWWGTPKAFSQDERGR
jgi:hypothetical protein